jgi:hypothetical protein
MPGYWGSFVDNGEKMDGPVVMKVVTKAVLKTVL